jgi:hypothetical protein
MILPVYIDLIIITGIITPGSFARGTRVMMSWAKALGKRSAEIM